jgi:hypothetical protein
VLNGDDDHDDVLNGDHDHDDVLNGDHDHDHDDVLNDSFSIARRQKNIVHNFKASTAMLFTRYKRTR